MTQWEIWKFPYPSADRPHWFVIISPPAWCENEQNPVLNGLLCTTLRPPGRNLRTHEVRLDATDGMDWDTVVKCSHVHELPRIKATENRGLVTVTPTEDWRDVADMSGSGLKLFLSPPCARPRNAFAQEATERPKLELILCSLRYLL